MDERRVQESVCSRIESRNYDLIKSRSAGEMRVGTTEATLKPDESRKKE